MRLLLLFEKVRRMAKPIRRSLARRLGRNIGNRRRASGLTQEQLAEHLDIDTLTVSRYETGNILPPLTVVELIARLLNTTIAELLNEAPVQPVEHAQRIEIWLANLPLTDRDWIEAVVKQLVERCRPSKSASTRSLVTKNKILQKPHS
jgi:transcriptional regulator with XRE-family HTH domain